MTIPNKNNRRQAVTIPLSAPRRAGRDIGPAAPLAGAQAYPEQADPLMVGYAAGGGVDAMARMLAARLPALLGQQVVVENRAGATGMIAADAVAKSAPDGYTLLMGESGHADRVAPAGEGAVDPLKAFTPVAGAFIAPLMIVANNNVRPPTRRS
jgi:tripartite-type tricarboxylate transporter receptor subunit TctC